MVACEGDLGLVWMEGKEVGKIIESLYVAK